MPAAAPMHPARPQPITWRHGPSGPRLLAPLLGLVGLVLVGAGAEELWRTLPTLTWPTTPGQVTAAHITEDRVGTYVGKYANSAVTAPRLHMRYRYRIGPLSYEGQVLDLLSPARRSAAADLRRYPVGTPVTVYYDPSNPARAVLEVGWPVRALFSALAGLMLLGLAWRLHRRSQPLG